MLSKPTMVPAVDFGYDVNMGYVRVTYNENGAPVLIKLPDGSLETRVYTNNGVNVHSTYFGPDGEYLESTYD